MAEGPLREARAPLACCLIEQNRAPVDAESGQRYHLKMAREADGAVDRLEAKSTRESRNLLTPARVPGLHDAQGICPLGCKARHSLRLWHCLHVPRGTPPLARVASHGAAGGATSRRMSPAPGGRFERALPSRPRGLPRRLRRMRSAPQLRSPTTSKNEHSSTTEHTLHTLGACGGIRHERSRRRATHWTAAVIALREIRVRTSGVRFQSRHRRALACMRALRSTKASIVRSDRRA